MQASALLSAEKQCTAGGISFSGRLSSRRGSHYSTKVTARNLLFSKSYHPKERKKMARLKKSNVGAGVCACASNHPITRSQTLVSKSKRATKATEKAQPSAVQPPPKSSSFRDSEGKKRYRPGSKALKEIRHYQRGIIIIILFP